MFSRDEKFCARLASRNLIELYQDGDFTKPKALIVASPETLAKKKDLPPEG